MGFLKTIKNKLIDVAVNSDMMATRFSLSIGAFLWSLFLFWPGDLFTPARHTYFIMSQIATENTWATLFFIQGWFALYTIVSGVKNHVTLALDAFLGCILWTSSTAACYMSHFTGWGSYQPPAAMSAEVILVFASWWHLIRYWAEEIEEHETIKNFRCCKLRGTSNESK